MKTESCGSNPIEWLLSAWVGWKIIGKFIHSCGKYLHNNVQ